MIGQFQRAAKRALVIFALVAGAPAAATTVVVTLTGTAQSGYDTTGVFGAPGTDLTGMAFVVEYRFNSGRGLRSQTIEMLPEPTVVADIIYGGSLYGAPSPLLGASIIINGTRVAVAGGTQDLMSTTPGESDFWAGTSFGNDNFRRLNAVIFDLFFEAIYYQLFTPLDLVVTSQVADIDFMIVEGGPPPGADPIVYANLVEAVLDVTHLRITVVPEPATWTCLVIGFGVVGARVRRRSRLQAQR